MVKYIIKRLINMIPVLLIVSILLFGMVQMMPGDPILAYVGEGSNLSPSQLDRIKKIHGLDKPLLEQYFIWITNIFKLEFGNSVSYNKPVNKIMGTFIKNSFGLNITSTILAFLVSVPIGVHAAVKKNKFFDSVTSFLSLVGVSIPTFFLGLLLIYVFSIKLKWTPLNGMQSIGVKFPNKWGEIKDYLHHLILPCLVLTASSVASYVKYIRSSMLEVIDEDYIRTARAKGLSERTVIYKHAFRNALIPVVTLVASSIVGLFSGAMMLETVFVWPGIGKVLTDALNKRDMPLILTSNLFFALLSLIGTLLADIGYGLVDPRIKYE